MITDERQITEHFSSKEFICPYSGDIKIDKSLVEKMEHIFKKLNASKCIISSGYRSPSYDRQVGGFLGRHSEGLAADCVFYDKEGKIIPSKIVVCVSWDLHELNGIAKIDNNYVHLDNRENSTYYGDETKGVSSYWTNPYTYFNVTKADVIKYTNEIESDKVNVYYRVRTINHGWLPEVKNLEDYAGLNNSPITSVAIKVDRGSIKYRVHLKNNTWLPYVTGYDINDLKNGFAGDNINKIDLIEVYYFTPDNIRPYKKAKYKVNDYSYQYDNEKTNNQDGYAGVVGVDVVKFSIVIE